MLSTIAILFGSAGLYCLYMAYITDRPFKKAPAEEKNLYSMDYAGDFSNKYSGNLPLHNLTPSDGSIGRRADEECQ